MAGKQYSINGDLTLDDHDFTKKMNELKKGVDQFAKQFEKNNKGIGEGFDKNKKKVDKFGDSITRQFTLANIASTSLMKGMSLLRSTIGNVAGEYIKLDKNMAKVRTLTQDTTFSTAMYRDELFRVSEATGFFASDLAEASYQALSAGVAIEDLGSFIAQMGVLAKGGFTDVTTAVDATTSIMNAYGKEVYTVEQISDKLIATQNRGERLAPAA